MYPFFDFSLSDIAKVSVGKVLTFGIGGSLWRFLPADKEKTTPGLDEENMSNHPHPQKELFYKHYDTSGVSTDTTYYTHKAIKVVSVFSVDPKPLFPSEVFGENDLVLYGEAAVLGVKNYPVYYDDVVERTPVMLGFNVPAFKLLDVLSVELEYHLWEYPNTIEDKYSYDSPGPQVPYIDPNLPDSYKEDFQKKIDVGQTEDNFKWSINFKRTFADHFALQGQFTKDHLRLPDFEGRPSFNPNFEAYGEWYYMLKAQYYF
jgi:hypothetical protein